jgi:hypothetical protein
MLANWEYNWQFPWPPVGTQFAVRDRQASLLNLEARFGVFTDGNVGAGNQIQATQGTVFITKATANALFLPLPLYGSPDAGGNDGQILRIVSTTAAAHTIQTAQPNGYNNSLKLATFSAATGNSFTVEAYNGIWWVLDFDSTVTFS